MTVNVDNCCQEVWYISLETEQFNYAHKLAYKHIYVVLKIVNWKSQNENYSFANA